MKHSTAFEQLCADARSRVREITVEEVKRKLDAGEQFHFIDVREDHEWQADEGDLGVGKGGLQCTQRRHGAQ